MKTLFKLMVILFGMFPGNLSAQDPSNFGHGTMTVNGAQSLGQRPLVVIVPDWTGVNMPNDPTPHPASYYRDFIFNIFQSPTVNGFLVENSLGRFIFSPANGGLVNMIDSTSPFNDGMEFTPAEIADINNTANDRNTEVNRGGHAINAASRAGFDFAAFDTNDDDMVTNDELAIVIVDNQMGDNGANRGAHPNGTGGPFTIQGTSKQFQGSVCLISQQVSFAVLAHEVIHLLDMKDTYGLWQFENLSEWMTLASAAVGNPDNMRTVHLDPWHKLKLGWCEPRIVNMRQGGPLPLPSNQGNEADKHVILYDPVKGYGEFFILEYRTGTSGTYNGYDKDVNSSGLVIWHVHQDSSFNLVNVPTPHYPGDRNENMPGVQLSEHYGLWMLGQDMSVGGGVNGPDAGTGAWGSGMTTPKLRWTIFPVDPNTYSENDYRGTDSVAHVYVRPFAPNATQITVEVFTDSDTYVDFFWNGPWHGTNENPYQTFEEGLIGVGWGGKLRMKRSGSVTSYITILDKPMTIIAQDGPVTISKQ